MLSVFLHICSSGGCIVVLHWNFCLVFCDNYSLKTFTYVYLLLGYPLLRSAFYWAVYIFSNWFVKSTSYILDIKLLYVFTYACTNMYMYIYIYTHTHACMYVNVFYIYGLLSKYLNSVFCWIDVNNFNIAQFSILFFIVSRFFNWSFCLPLSHEAMFQYFLLKALFLNLWHFDLQAI